jgi:4-amino-4-deoxy-L-arabinose transferase-like glycosyltransferase
MNVPRWIGPLLIVAAGVIMLAWSWQTWPDPLVDFGAQLYIPWRIVAGQSLYRDIAYYNGPLSQYLNAGLFTLFGVGLRTLVWANLAILALVLTLIYRLACRTSGHLAATVVGLTFVLVFAFGQGVAIGNYNWITPYVHELTYGVALGLLCIALVDRYQRTERPIWLLAAGITLGLIFLTKAEPMAAATAATLAQLASHRPARQKFTLFLCSAAIVPVIAIFILSTFMPFPIALRGVAGSWPWVLDTQIAALPFYRTVSGLDHVSANLAAMFRWTLGYALLLLLATFIALRTHRRRKAISLLVFAIVAAIIAWRFFPPDWNSMIRPLPLCLAAILIPTFRRRDPLRLALVIFSLVLLAKISLNAHVFHYGFVLAMPGTLVLVAVAAQHIPDWIKQRNGSAGVFRAAIAAVWLAGITATLYVDAHFFAARRWTVAAGPDVFFADSRGPEIQHISDLIRRQTPASGTLAVFPQGLMLNYLTRRPDSIPQVNFMPPEVLAAGENVILSILAARPPDLIVLNTSSIAQDQFQLDQSYFFGRSTLAWIQQNYEPVVAEYPPPTPLSLVLLRRKTP